MTIRVHIVINGNLIMSYLYEFNSFIPLPQEGEWVINPQTDGLAVKVERRIFQYEHNTVAVTLECS